jgi:hypothetical protein
MEGSDQLRSGGDVPQTYSIPLQTYLDQVRATFDGQIAEIRRAVDIAAAAAMGEAVPLRQYFEAILEEHRHAEAIAEQEREKAAVALRAELARAIDEGDRNLRGHIQQQVEQIGAALQSAERLETTRFDSLRRGMELITTAAADAINKAEQANDKRFDAIIKVAEAQNEALRREVSELTLKVSRVGA